MMSNKIGSLFQDSKDRLVFFVGCFASFYVAIVGRVYVGELIIFLLYIFKPETRASLPPAVKKLTKLMWLWLIGAIVTDLYRHTPPFDMLKGIVSQLFLISLVPFAYWALRDKPSRWLVFYLGTVVSSQLTYYLITSQTDFGSSDIWRTYSYMPLISCLAVLLYWKGKHGLSYIVLLGLGVWILFGGSRNGFITCSMSALVLYYMDRVNGSNPLVKVKVYQNKVVVLGLCMLIGASFISTFYESLASSGALGERAYEKYNKQKNSDFGLASGRLEAIMDIDLISKSPIIGYGSFAKDKTNYVYNFYVAHNIDFHPSRFDIDLDSVENMLPRHSRFFGMWMWHGIFAGIFWIFILSLFIKTLRNGSFLLEPRLCCLSVYTLFSELWKTFFSIMSDRLIPIFFWIFLILINEEYQNVIRSQ